MVNLTDKERAVLRALSELEPATVRQIASLAKLSTSEVKEILEALAKKGLLTSLHSKGTASDDDSDPT